MERQYYKFVLACRAEKAKFYSIGVAVIVEVSSKRGLVPRQFQRAACDMYLVRGENTAYLSLILNLARIIVHPRLQYYRGSTSIILVMEVIFNRELILLHK